MRTSPHITQYIKEFDFVSLFLEEMGWGTFDIPSIEIIIDDEKFILVPIANIGSFAAFECSSDMHGNIPLSQTRKKIEKVLSRSYRENLIIFVDGKNTTQVWQWIKKDSNHEVTRYIRYSKNQSPELLIQKIKQMSFTIEELDNNGNVTLLDVRNRVVNALDVEKVTKQFYEKFTNERKGFSGFINGIPEKEFKDWYISVILNRLMFIYFIQKKGYLDGDVNYLENKLEETRNSGLDFYKDFLIPLFFNGFAKKNRDEFTEKLLGKIPYLNGGLFAKHQIEEKFPNIEIESEGFENMFKFFQQYDWHLDTNPQRTGNEINPDVIGYIFEKYINQKENGAYYTQEDITEYMARNTIVPFILESLFSQNDQADEKFYANLKIEPGRYIFKSVQKGIDKNLNIEIEKGIQEISARENWNLASPLEYGNPSELWREVVDRRVRYEEIIEMIEHDLVTNIDDLIKNNINVEQLLLDYINQLESPGEIYNLYLKLSKISVLDPTCGSGAFLFAALNLLHTIYQSVIEKIEVKLGDWAIEDIKGYETDIANMRNVIDTINLHTNRDYFIYKTIIINNLYGVDLMEEATEICKLRLFLKLISQTNNVEHIEPLPDIDFNIRAGNMLVGFSTLDEAKLAINSSFDFDNVEERIENESKEISILFEEFQLIQNEVNYDTHRIQEVKSLLQEKLTTVAEILNKYLANQYYGVETNDEEKYKAWKDLHLPIHWFNEFYKIINNGGFDIIIGNPPYIQKSKINYKIYNYQTINLQDIYAPCVEKSLTELMSDKGYYSMIIPNSSISTPDYDPLRKVFNETDRHFFAANFGVRPSKLFNGADKRVTILTASSVKKSFKICTTKYRRWISTERPVLLEDTHYIEVEPNMFNIRCYPKVSNILEMKILNKLQIVKKSITNFETRGPTNYSVQYTRKLQYFIQFFLEAPKIFNSHGEEVAPSELKKIYFNSKEHQLVALAVLNSSLFFWYFTCFSDSRNVNQLQIKNFPFDFNKVNSEMANTLSDLSLELMQNLKDNSVMITRNEKAGQLNIQSFKPRHSKVVIDKIDKVLGEYYKFTDDEVDFIINHDIKYRMGLF